MFSDDEVVVITVGHVSLCHLPFVSTEEVARLVERVIDLIAVVEGSADAHETFFLSFNIVGKFGEKSEGNLYIAPVGVPLTIYEVHLEFRKLDLVSGFLRFLHLSHSRIVDIKELPFGYHRVDQVLAVSVLFSKVLFVFVEDLCKLLFGLSILGSILEEPLGLVDSLSVGHHVGE